MKSYLKQSFILSFFFITPSSVAVAADAEFCTDYVLSAIAQYWEGVNNNCGFTGAQWSSNYKGQYSWCLSAHQWVAENETRDRKKLLEACSLQIITEVANDEDTERVDISPAAQKSMSIGEEFLRAIVDNDVTKAKALVGQGADIAFQTQDEVLIKELGMSYRKEKKDITNKASEANKSQKSSTISESALSLAISKGLLDVGLWLLEENKDALDESEITDYKSTLLGNALIESVKEDKVDVVKALLNRGASVNYELDDNSGTPLYFAVMKGFIPICKLLLNKGANPRYTINGGGNMINLALDKVDLLELLLEHKADPNSNGELTEQASLPIVKSVTADNTQAVELLMKYGANADVYDYEVSYPLISAIQNKQIDVIKLLLKYNANVNVVYNSSSPGSCVKGEKNIIPLSAALETESDVIIALLNDAKAKSLESLCQ